MEHADLRIYRLHYNELGHLHVCLLDDKILEAALVDDDGTGSVLWNIGMEFGGLSYYQHDLRRPS